MNIGNNLNLSAQLTADTLCKSGKTITFSLDDNPTTAAIDGPYTIATATTNGSGVAATSIASDKLATGRVSADGDICRDFRVLQSDPATRRR